MFTFATDYCIAAFISTTGALQFAFSIGGLYGLLIFKCPLVARTLGLALVVAALVFFFAVGERNINDYEGGLDAPTQAFFFFWGAFAALVFTLALTSIVNRHMRGAGANDGAGGPDSKPDTGPNAGIDALRHSNYALALSRSAAYWWKKWKRSRTRTSSYPS